MAISAVKRILLRTDIHVSPLQIICGWQAARDSWYFKMLRVPGQVPMTPRQVSSSTPQEPYIVLSRLLYFAPTRWRKTKSLGFCLVHPDKCLFVQL